MTLQSFLVVLAIWLALSVLTTVLLSIAMRRRGRDDREDLEAELRRLIEREEEQ